MLLTHFILLFYFPLGILRLVQAVLLLQLLDAWIVPQPCKNVWVTLAHALQQDHLCLSTSAAENPMSTCLVGIPAKLGEYPSTIWNIQDELNKKNPPDQ